MPGTEKEEEDKAGSDDDDDDRKDRIRGKKKPMTEYEKKRLKIEETKKSLPVFPFRQQLLDAIAEHQVNPVVVILLNFN